MRSLTNTFTRPHESSKAHKILSFGKVYAHLRSKMAQALPHHSYSTRSTKNHWLVGPYLEKLSEINLPTELDLVRYYLFKKDDKRYSKTEKNNLCKEIREIIKGIWIEKANLPVQIDPTIYNAILKLVDRLEDIDKRFKFNRQNDSDWIAIERKKFVKLFDIFACRCFSSVLSQELILQYNCKCNIAIKLPSDDLEFYANQKFVFDSKERMVISNSKDKKGSLIVQKRLKDESTKERAPILLKKQIERESSQLNETVSVSNLDLSCSSDSESLDSDEEYVPKSLQNNKSKNTVDYSSVVSYAMRKGVGFETLSAIINLTKAAEGEEDESKFVSKNKLYYQGQRLGSKLSSKHAEISNVLCIKGDGKKGKARVESSKQEVQDKYTVIYEPGGKYLDHFVPQNGTGEEIGLGLFDTVVLYESEKSLLAVGGDNTSTNTGSKKGAFHWLETFLGRPLQIIACTLHYIELPFKRLVTHHIGKTTGPKTRKNPLGHKVSKINENLAEVVEFEPVPGMLSQMDEALLVNNDQKYAFHMAMGIQLGPKYILEIFGKMPPGPGEQHNARWLKTAAAIMRLFIQMIDPPEPLRRIVSIILNWYLPLFFNIKRHPHVCFGSKHFFDSIKFARDCMNAEEFKVAERYIKINSFWAHPESILLGAMWDDNLANRKRAVQIVIKVRSKPCTSKRPFTVPGERLNMKATSYLDMIDFNASSNREYITDPPLLRMFDDATLLSYTTQVDKKLPIPDIPSHSVNNERAVQDTSKASLQVVGENRTHERILTYQESREAVPVISKKSTFTKKKE